MRREEIGYNPAPVVELVVSVGFNDIDEDMVKDIDEDTGGKQRDWR